MIFFLTPYLFMFVSAFFLELFIDKSVFVYKEGGKILSEFLRGGCMKSLVFADDSLKELR